MPSTFTTADGATLCVREWTPGQDPWLHLALVHGLGEHAGRYEAVGAAFAKAGISIRAHDHRGHGASSGRRGDVGRWVDLTGDVGHMVERQRAAADGGPVALMGHSMGGLIVLDAVLSGAATPDLLVLSAPALGDGLPTWQHAIVPILARVWPSILLDNAWPPEYLSRDPQVGAAAAADPLQLTKATARLGAYGFDAQDRVRASLDDLRIPTLVVHGAEDALVPATVTETLGRLPGVTRKLYPDLRHETLFEPEGPEVAADIIAWLQDATEDCRAAGLELYPASEAATQASTRSR